MKKEVAILIEAAEQQVKSELNPQIASVEHEHALIKEKLKIIVPRQDFKVSYPLN